MTKAPYRRIDGLSAAKSQKGAAGHDPLEVLGEHILVSILGSLSADDLARCTQISKLWGRIVVLDELWLPHCMDLIRSNPHAKVSQLILDTSCEAEKQQKQDCRRWYSEHMDQKDRTQITKEDLCGLCWKFRFKRQAGEFWLSWDPYWTKSGPQMQRVFCEDGTVLGIPSHEPFWFQDSECRWRFTKSREGKRGGPFVKVNHWPSLVVSRHEGFGWRMEDHGDWPCNDAIIASLLRNCWVVYESIDPEAQDAAAMLSKWDSNRARRPESGREV